MTGAATAALADTTEAPESALEEVTVTAQFRKQAAQTAPLAITAVDSRMLESRGQTDLAQVASQAPNVTLAQNGGFFGSSMVASIRGVGQYDNSPAFEPGVGIYVDDVYYATLNGSDLALLDLDHLEILRGPQGTLAGMNSIGGAVKLFSKKPDGSGHGYFEASYGSLDEVSARGAIDLTVVPDTVFARVSAVTEHRNGYVSVEDYTCTHPGSTVPSLVGVGSGCTLGHEGGISYTAVRGALRWLASDKVEVNLAADYTNNNSEVSPSTLLYTQSFFSTFGVPYGSQFIPQNRYTSYANFYDPGQAPFRGAFITPMQQQLRSTGVSASLNWDVSENFSVKAISAYRSYYNLVGYDEDDSPLVGGQGEDQYTHYQFSQELQLNGSAFNHAVDYTLGGYYFRQKTIFVDHQDLPYAAPFFDFLVHDPVTEEVKAGFAHADWHATDKLSLIAGLRYTKENKAYTFERLNPDGTPFALLASLNGVTGRYVGSKVDYRANISYQWTSNVMTYAQFSTGFKGGGINPRPFTAAQVQSFGPETVDAYEVGLKSEFLEHRVRVNLSGFYNKYKDIQLALLSCPQYGPAPGCALPANAGDANVKGVELETELSPVQHLQADVSVSYLNFDYTRIQDSVRLCVGAPGVCGINYGMITPYTPTVKASFGVQYEIPLANAGSLLPRLDASYQGGVYVNPVNAWYNHLGGYTVLNGHLTWRAPADDWQAAVEVTNFTNKFYYLSAADLYTVAGFVTATPAAPREWNFKVTKRF